VRLAGNLFIKVFLAFWLVTCAVLGSWMLTADYFDSLPPGEEQYGHRPSAAPHRLLLKLIYDLQNHELAQLEQDLENLHGEHGIAVYLLDDTGADLFNKDVPPGALAAASGLKGGRRRALFNSPRGRFVAHQIYRPDVGQLRAVFRFERRPGAILRILGSNPALRLALAVLVSGLVCYGLSRLVTRRLRALQIASRRLAGGDLDTRIQVRDQGGDETDELARDFNSMAGQLQRRLQAQRRLLGDVSHELRSPLARLRIALALAQDDEAGRDAHLERIEIEAQRLEELIAQLLSSQVAGGELDSYTDLVELLVQSCADARYEGRNRSVHVAFHCALEQALVTSGGDLLHKAFENILRNALAYTEEGSGVDVFLESGENAYRVRVVDQGPGVPEDEIDHLFDAFYRVDTARSRNTGGYGLGLSIARRSIEQHGGSISARNLARGLEGSVSLPKAS
jgi:two-component system sensor histidine kinase CpxA